MTTEAEPSLSNILAAAEAHVSIAPEKLFEIGGLVITNSIFYGWVASLVIIGLLYLAMTRTKLSGTRGPAQLVEAVVELLLKAVEGSLGSRRRALKYGPFFITLFFFILLSNWLGLVPGVGSASYADTPVMRPFTADLNATLAMALFGMITIHILAIRENGPMKHLRHYFPGKLYNPATYLIGAFEIFSELTRLLTLALRLFLAIAVGEILVHVFAVLGGNFGALTVLPFMLLEIFIAMLQAYIFVILTASYLSLMLSKEEPHGEPLM